MPEHTATKALFTLLLYPWGIQPLGGQVEHPSVKRPPVSVLKANKQIMNKITSVKPCKYKYENSYNF